MEILEAFDLARSLRGAAELVGVITRRLRTGSRPEAAGDGLPLPEPPPRPRVDAFAEKLEEWDERARVRIRADKAHKGLVARGYMRSERTTRRAVARADRAWCSEDRA